MIEYIRVRRVRILPEKTGGIRTPPSVSLLVEIDLCYANMQCTGSLEPTDKPGRSAHASRRSTCGRVGAQQVCPGWREVSRNQGGAPGRDK
jgi:hypothetical protein